MAWSVCPSGSFTGKIHIFSLSLARSVSLYEQFHAYIISTTIFIYEQTTGIFFIMFFNRFFVLFSMFFFLWLSFLFSCQVSFFLSMITIAIIIIVIIIFIFFKLSLDTECNERQRTDWSKFRYTTTKHKQDGWILCLEL